ncbi:MAG: 5-formyltetrahydrofolate cyclo-ligase [Pseudomonadales bacterium]|nr:5-formyltetrahydrofolate cyclo-ligase [Pseudomonadales bacterium]
MNTQLRKTIRQQRRNISDSQKALSGKQLAQVCMDHEWLEKSQHIACFLDHDGEISTGPLIKKLHAAGKSVYLPVLDPDKTNELLFFLYQPNDPLIPNRFGIPEPDITRLKPISSEDLDLVLMPLVAFDEKGNRLGMGGGYYDRSFAFTLSTQQTKQDRKPCLAGVAYSFQQVDQLHSESWDVPLEIVFTELAVINTQ